MASYLTPGVYYERVDTSAPAIAAVRTDVAGFVGLAVRGPLDTPVPVQSWRQFEAHFGGFSGAAFLAYAVRGFFENGGRRCWVVRVASRDTSGGASASAAAIKATGGGDAWRVSESSPGVWGNDLSFMLKPTHRAQTTTDPSASTPEASAVLSTSGFARAALVRLAQDGVPDVWKVVSDVDAVNGALVWVHPDPRSRLPYDSPVSGFRTDRPVLVESLEYTLVVRESNVPVAVYENLSLVPESETYGPRMLAPWTAPDNTDAGSTLPPPPLPIAIEELRGLPLSTVEPLDVSSDAVVACTGGSDGLALLTADDFIGEEVSPSDDDEARARKTRGLGALELVAEVSVVAVPDIHVRPYDAAPRAPLPPCVPDPCLPQTFVPPAPPRAPSTGELPPVFSEADVYRVQAALVAHCESLRDRVALLDAPAGTALDSRLGVGAVRAWRSRFDTKYSAFYFPWLRVVDPLRGAASLTRDIPPTGHVAGQYARTDFEVGVHKAPANEPLQWTEDVTVETDDATHGVLNPLGVNVVRVLAGRGIRIYGARTVSSDPSWRYVNVRRLLLMIEKAIDISTQWAVFEPNDTLTRNKIRLSLTSFLLALWRKGALAGDRPDAAFFVKCDEQNNPAPARADGRLLAEVGVAPAVPFEFVVLRVGRQDNEFEIAEASAAGGL
ncbi:MAG TPA: phage tail sheath C-terminal domain-containing protein [Pyrinomonadaceae bacterium]|nr:phage tail sheath C-terminal domain-containing protein [Pyrinomonadaceae bacterium]